MYKAGKVGRGGADSTFSCPLPGPEHQTVHRGAGVREGCEGAGWGGWGEIQTKVSLSMTQPPPTHATTTTATTTATPLWAVLRGPIASMVWASASRK